jgi:hypothetical protein
VTDLRGEDNEVTRAPLALADLAGRWNIVATNFPMWLSGKRTRPAFNYAVGQGGLDDVVTYEQGGRSRQIVGFDRPDDATNRAFTWRGRGLLFLFASRWRVLHHEPEWMLIGFEKTLATPAGADLVARGEPAREAVEERLSALDQLMPSGQQPMLVIV